MTRTPVGLWWAHSFSQRKPGCLRSQRPRLAPGWPMNLRTMGGAATMIPRASTSTHTVTRAGVRSVDSHQYVASPGTCAAAGGAVAVSGWVATAAGSARGSRAMAAALLSG
jgi:hypothetical protein